MADVLTRDMIDLALMEQVVRTVEKISAGVDKITKSITGAGAAADAASDAANKKVKERTEKSFKEIDRLFERQKGSLRELEGSWRKFGDVMRSQMTAHGGFASAGDAMGITGPRGIGASIKSVQQNLFAQMPMGGLLGLALFGAVKKQEWVARATDAARMLSGVGDIATGMVPRLTGMIAKYWAAWGMGPEELKALTGAFAEFGSSSKDLLEKAGFSVEGFGDDVIGVSFAMDTLTKSATGTFGRAIAQAVQTSGRGIKETTREIVALGLEMRNTGVNVGQFIGQLMQSTSALRFQGQGTEDLRKQVLLLKSAYEASGIRGPRLGAMVAGGMQAMAGASTGLNEGMAAHIGERIGKRNGKNISGIDAIIAMQEGTAGRDNAHLGEVVAELGRFAAELAPGNENTQKFSLQKLGIDKEAARAIVETNKQIQKEVAGGKSLDEAIADNQEALNNAMKARADEQSPWEKAMRLLTAELVKISGGILTTLVASFQSFSIDALTGSFKTATGLGGPVTQDERDAMSRSAQAANIMQNESFPMIVDGLRGMGKVLGDTGSSLIPSLEKLTKPPKKREGPVPPPETVHEGASKDLGLLGDVVRKFMEREGKATGKNATPNAPKGGAPQLFNMMDGVGSGSLIDLGGGAAIMIVNTTTAKLVGGGSAKGTKELGQ